MIRWQVGCALAATIALALTGCDGGKKGARSSYATGKAPAHPVRIAVLPFGTDVRDESASPTVTDQVVVALLASGAVEVIEPGMVSAAMLDAEIMRADQDLGREAIAQLKDAMPEVDLLVVGRINEFEMVSGGTQTYPSVSITARMINAFTGEIVWAESRSATGGGGLFGRGRVTSLSIMSQQVVRKLAASVKQSADRIFANVEAGRINGTAQPSPIVPAPTPTAPSQPPPPEAPGETPGEPVQPDVTEPAAPSSELQSPDHEVTQDELEGLLIQVEGFERNGVTYKKTFHASVSTNYSDGSTYVVKIIDYGTPEDTLKFLQHYSPDDPQVDFHGHPAFRIDAAEPEYQQLLVACGRFGLFVTHGKDRIQQVDALALPLVENALS